MRVEERSEHIHDALNFLDEDMIEEVEALRGSVNDTKNSKLHGKEHIRHVYTWRKWAALAASVCLLVMIGSIWDIQKNGFISLDKEDFVEKNEMQDALEGEPSYGEEDSVFIPEGEMGNVQENETNPGLPETSENKPIKEFLDLENYAVIYFSTKSDGDTSGDAKLLDEASLEIADKFIESVQRGMVYRKADVSWKDILEKAQGHLFFELKDGKCVHLVLLGDGVVCSYETPNAWVKMDGRVYKTFVETLGE